MYKIQKVGSYSVGFDWSVGRENERREMGERVGGEVEEVGFITTFNGMHYKIQTNVPKDAVDSVRLAMGNAGAGVIGNYTHCAFMMPGVGYFLPGEGANPVIGAVGMMETVEEYRLEFVCTTENISAVIKALKDSHPYEEPPIEIYKLEDSNSFLL